MEFGLFELLCSVAEAEVVEEVEGVDVEAHI